MQQIARLSAALLGSALLLADAAHAQAVAKTTTTTRHYDCSKAGNANKAVCKTAPAPAAPAAPSPAAPPAMPSHTTAVHTRTTTKTTTTGPATTNAGGPNGATAQCKDGTYSHSAHRSGTCAGHKGVATWY